MKTNESTYRMVDCVYLLCVFDVFSFAALGERKSEETSRKKPKKRVLTKLFFCFCGPKPVKTVLFPCEGVAIFGILSLA